MSKPRRLLILSMLLFVISASAQKGKIDSTTFFTDERPFEMTLTSDLKNLMNKKMEKEYQAATVAFRLPDSTVIKEDIRIQTRGKFRLANCYMPPIMMNFKNNSSPKLRPLGKLKLVVGCATSTDDEQLIIKEYLSYKIFNMITPKSFQVRLVKITYEDTRGKVKKYSQYGFLLEDVDAMAARNKCVEVEGKQYLTESTDRQQMTLTAIFEYMIGNTDWSVPHYHNIKLMRAKDQPNGIPYAVPYDLNHCGLVNATYALPPEELDIKSVRERLYRGFPRSMEELEVAIGLFLKQKEKTLSMISNCQWMSNRCKKETIGYLEDFYKTLESKSSVKSTFIDNARRE